MFSVSVSAEEAERQPPQTEATQKKMDETIEQVIDGLDFTDAGGIEIDMRILGGGQEVSGVADTVREIAGGAGIDPEAALSALLSHAAQTLAENARLLPMLMAPVLLAALVSQVIEKNGGIGRNVCFILTLIPMVLLTMRELEHTRETIVRVTARMEDMLPLLLTLLTALGGNASSAFLHPMVVMASGSMVFLSREVVLRLVMCTCAVTLVNHLSERVHLNRMAQLLRSAVCWLLGVSFTVFIGAMSLQGVCSASIDGVAIRAAKYAVDNFVPVVGGMFSDTMDMLVGCTLIVKNAMGITCVLALCGALLSPLLHTFAAVCLMKISAALLEPVADAEIISAMSDFSRLLVLFLITMLCVGTMYFLLIVQMLLVGNLTVMLR